MLLFGAFLILNVLSLVAEIRLSTTGKQVDAEIQEWATYGDPNHPNSHSTDYEVQYRFSVDGEEYSFSDSTGRKNLWASLPKADWELSQNTGTLPVIYDPKNPWNNRPENPDDSPYGGPIAGIVILGGIFGLLTAVFVQIRRGTHRVA